ncbi:hypothetical protein [Aneurinibacillus aneurinilyticus]|uniref:Uncharacterized protein n=1 Tax=Aneurinibacillus aneurinilyticus ATCC 12856 TaxID=649747 RepID=U1WT20_ANEAE|nr:hypothetical protein [Aneurinibacillus aneurinilyticus]ERI05408.1 hypothetical protein HMPREF0083_05691 [Aneurinibacillus aneurinilyticus ATCC 12856]MED0704883.1 hypothetical protein [Aneurinibacillus aneurinilyticus]MED0724075.1 hypothetical protein [Aneurinibacillus aneurinilyticus]MED0731928.1 hypothetical protein [Aneurinibacillus aneurinilyticus]MED0741542.1 hypothetical protein [Aneurinibacillus aneurinilyticus]
MTNKKKILTTVGIIAIIAISYSVGSTTAKTKLNEKTVSYKQIEEETKKKNDELKTITDNLNAIKANYEEAKKLVAEKEQIKGDIQIAQREHDSTVEKMYKASNDLKAKQAELERISNAVIAKQQEPKQLPAGHFIAGKDIQAGRYKVTPVGRGSNYVVRDITGRLKVNTILGNDYGVPEYVVELEDQDTIQAESRVKYTAIE